MRCSLSPASTAASSGRQRTAGLRIRLAHTEGGNGWLQEAFSVELMRRAIGAVLRAP